MCTALRERRSVIGLPLDDTGLSNESGRGGSTPERVRGSSRSSSSHSAAVFFGEPMERSVVPPRSIPSKDMAPAPSEVTLFLGPGNSVPNSSTCGVKTTFIRPRNIAWPEMGWRTPPGRERLVFFVDLHCDEHQLSWPTLAGPPGTQSNNMTLELFKQCISLITMTRSRMDVDTEFSLCVLLDSAVCISDLTIDASEFLKQVNQLSGLERFESLDLASALAVLRQKSAEVLAKDADSQQQKTPVLVRGILLYARSDIVPTLDGSEWEQAAADQRILLDTLYVHQQRSSGCNRAVLDVLARASAAHTAHEAHTVSTAAPTATCPPPYLIASALNPKKVLRSAALLSASARQRPPQPKGLVNAMEGKHIEQPIGGGESGGGGGGGGIGGWGKGLGGFFGGGSAAEIPMGLPVR